MRIDGRRCWATSRVRRSVAQRQQGQQRDDEKRRLRRGRRARPPGRSSRRAARPRSRRTPTSKTGWNGRVEGAAEAHVEQPQDRQHAESESAEQRDDPRAPGWQHQDEGDEEQALDRDPEEGARRQVVDLVRDQQRGPDQQQGQRRGHLSPAGNGRPPARRHSAQTLRPNDSTSRPTATRSMRDGHGIGQDAGRRDDQHDAHDRGDHPGPLPGRQRLRAATAAPGRRPRTRTGPDPARAPTSPTDARRTRSGPGSGTRRPP